METGDIIERRVATARIGQLVRERAATAPAPDGAEPWAPVLFVHGNASSSVFWTGTLRALPPHVRGLAVDLRGFGGSDPAPVDATRGVADFADDVVALLDALDVPRVHLVGWSLGGGVVLRNLLDVPGRIASLTLVNPVSPFGFGGTHDVAGTLNAPDGSPSGAGTVSPEFVKLLAAGDDGDSSEFSPRNVLLQYYVKPGFVPADLDDLVAGMLSTVIGEDNYPGDVAFGPNWPGPVPGDRGVLNTLDPRRFRITDLASVDPAPPLLWIRGLEDLVVSDTSMFDMSNLGRLGFVPGWPGEPGYAPQPMVAQTARVLETYPGSVRAVEFAGVAHSPQLEAPERFLAELLETVTAAERG